MKKTKIGKVSILVAFLLLATLVVASPFTNLRKSTDFTEPHPVLNGFSGYYDSYLGSLEIDYVQHWNLIAGFPADIPDSVQALYYYSPEDKRYYEVYPDNTEYAENEKLSDKAIGGNAALWMYSSEPGSTEVFFENYKSFQPLYEGWNFVGLGPAVPEDGMSISEFEGTCSIDKAYRYDANIRRWQSITQIEGNHVGEGILVSVPKDCYIEYPDTDFVPSPPAFP